jgi:hypothetical protein
MRYRGEKQFRRQRRSWNRGDRQGTGERQVVGSAEASRNCQACAMRWRIGVFFKFKALESQAQRTAIGTGE